MRVGERHRIAVVLNQDRVDEGGRGRPDIHVTLKLQASKV